LFGGPAALLTVLSATGCELQETTLAQPEDILVAEAFVQLFGEEAEATLLLHRTFGGVGASEAPPNADVQIHLPEVGAIRMAEVPLSDCVEGELPDQFLGTCYGVSPGLLAVHGGDELTLEVDVADGRRLLGTTRVPGDFQLLQPLGTPVCYQEKGLPFEVRWTSSSEAWAYLSESLIFGLRETLGSQGIEVEDDPLLLTGLSVSASDTTIVFPREFGVFDRFDTDRDVLVALQESLPVGASARVIVAALDRNYANWVRGGDFNPSGQVRIPSIQGDGTGVFGSVVRRTFRVETDPPQLGRVPCVRSGPRE
jgi:hypothetical protein